MKARPIKGSKKAATVAKPKSGATKRFTPKPKYTLPNKSRKK